MYYYPQYYPYMNDWLDSFEFSTQPRWKDFEHWMENLNESIKNIPLNQLTIPGTHDSGTYQLYTDEIYNVDDFTGIAPTIAGPIIRAMAVTQNTDIYSQLVEGNRYIDLRFAKDNKGRIRIVHTVFGNSADSIFDQIKRFLDSHPKEIVIIDIQHINNLSSSDELVLKNIIMNTIGSHLAPRNSFKTTSTISDFYKEGKNAVILYDRADSVKNEPLYWYRNDSTIRSPWYNTNDYNYLMNKIDEGLKSLPRTRNYYYVSQAVLTINTSEIKSIILNLLKWLPVPIYGQIRFAQEFNKLVNTSGIYNLISPHFTDIDQWLITHKASGSTPYYPNIFMQDFYQKSTLGILIDFNKSYTSNSKSL